MSDPKPVQQIPPRPAIQDDEVLADSVIDGLPDPAAAPRPATRRQSHRAVSYTHLDVYKRQVLIARDGGEWPIDGNAAPILDAAGRPAGVVLVFQDISNRRKAEKEKEISEVRYRRLFESAHDGILILDAVTTKVLDVNPFMSDLLGYPREHFLGKELWEIGVFKDAEMSKRAMATLQRLGRIRYEDLPLQHKDGCLLYTSRCV